MKTFTKMLGLAILGFMAMGMSQMASARGGRPAELGFFDSKVITATLRIEGKKAESVKELFCGIRDVCHVDSRVNAYIKVYVNGVYRGTIPPWGDIYPFVNDLPGAATTLYAVSTCGRYSWSMTVSQNYRDFQWILYP